jgi:hypothetical protein
VDECLVSWVGYGASSNTWEPEHALEQTASSELARYNRKRCTSGSLPTQQQRDKTIDADRGGATVQVQWLTKHIIDPEYTDEWDDRTKEEEAFYSPALELMARNASYHDADAQQQEGVVQACNAIFNANVTDLYPVPTNEEARVTSLEVCETTPVDTEEIPNTPVEVARWEQLQADRLDANDDDSTITGELILTAEDAGEGYESVRGVRPALCRAMMTMGKSLEKGIDVWEAARRARGKNGYLKLEADDSKPDHDRQVTAKEIGDYIYDPELSHAAPTALLQYAAALLHAAAEQDERNIETSSRQPTAAISDPLFQLSSRDPSKPSWPVWVPPSLPSLSHARSRQRGKEAHERNREPHLPLTHARSPPVERIAPER